MDIALVLDVVIVIVCLGGLWYGAENFVEGAAIIARRLGISEFLIGLTIVAIGTSAPEFAVSALASLKGHASISVGNVVGSNIFNLGIVLGIIALIRPVRTTVPLVKRDGSLLLLAVSLLLLFFRDLRLEFYEGFILMLTLASYIGYLIYKHEASDEEVPDGEFGIKHIIELLVGLGVILASSHFLVESASDVARAFGVSEWLIGVTIVAAGTSTPELVTSLVAVLKSRHGLLAGGLVGSDIFNMLGVLGLASMLNPMMIDASSYNSLYLMLGSIVLVLICMRTGFSISRREGGLLLAVALIRWGLDIFGVTF